MAMLVIKLVARWPFLSFPFRHLSVLFYIASYTSLIADTL